MVRVGRGSRALGKSWTSFLGLACLLLPLSGCLDATNAPINPVLATVRDVSPKYIPDAKNDGSTVVGLAFSGGGTRAAAFAYGVLQEMNSVTMPDGEPMVESIRMLSGASGGAITAAYFGYKGSENFQDFREKYLIRKGEANLRTDVSLVNLIRAYNGGVNDRSNFADWLDKEVFDGARFQQLKREGGPIIWINASDIYNRTPFLFSYDTFASLCSDLDEIPIADAVAASAAVPVVFSPVVVKAWGPRCNYQQPEWLTKALADPKASARLQAYSRALMAYQDKNRLKYVKLVDGGITDNIGVTGFTLERSAAGTPYGPLSPEQAIKLRTLLFLVADAGREPEPDWGETIGGPKGADLVDAVSDTSISSSVRDEFDALRFAVTEWEIDLIRYRCGLSAAAVRKVRGTTDGWDCRDVHLYVDDVTFHDLPQAMRQKLRNVPTRLQLPVDQVDLVIAAGRESLALNPSYREAIANMWRGRQPPATKRVVATASP